MVGKKGRSGRKPNESGRVMRAVALYIPMYELDTAHFNSTSAKYQWFPEDWFTQFKRINGNKWQERVRTMIMSWVRQYERSYMWCCNCSGRTKKWHFQHEGSCPRCEYVPGELERYKTVAEVNKHIHKPIATVPLTHCSKCGTEYSTKETEHGTLKFCEVCQ